MAGSGWRNRPEATGYLKVLEALRYWDPIRVLDDPSWPRDEYDGYAAEVVRLLDRGVSAEDLTQVLRQIAREQMGVESNAERNAKVAADLVASWKDRKRP
jgi:hypothetical protein